MGYEPAVQTWINRVALAELAETGIAQVDIDQLLNPPPAKAARAMLDCMEIAVAVIHATDTAVKGLVVIPLPAVEGEFIPPTHHPSLAEVVAVDWVYGPGRDVPGLYLLRQDMLQPDAEVEEYRLPLRLPDPGQRAYYRAWRTLDERDRYPGEWSRALYVHTS